MILQRQISYFLRHEKPLYNKEELEQKRVAIEPVLKDLDRIRRNRTRYWIQKYLLQHRGETFPAIILYALKRRYRILMTDFLLIADIKKENGPSLSEGQRIRVKIKKSDPWNDDLRLEYSGE